MAGPQVKAPAHQVMHPHLISPFETLCPPPSVPVWSKKVRKELVGTSCLCFKELNMKDRGTPNQHPNPPLCLYPPLGSEREAQAEAGQARICAGDKTGNRKETTQSPALPDVTGPPFIFHEGRKKNNINNIRCSMRKATGK